MYFICHRTNKELALSFRRHVKKEHAIHIGKLDTMERKYARRDWCWIQAVLPQREWYEEWSRNCMLLRQSTDTGATKRQSDYDETED